jgi:hypothetical protein
MAVGMGGADGIRGTRAEEGREEKVDRSFGGTIELSGKILKKHTRDLAGDLLRLKRGHYITNVVYKCACMFQLQMSFI